jgi:hypothetical protein
LAAFFVAVHAAKERKESREPVERVSSRASMIAAVSFNGAGLHFRAELFIVTSIIAWTYLLHAYYKREAIDYRYKKAGVVEKTPTGADKYWELGHCLAHGKCPLEKGVVNNLKFLIEIRHEIEHRSTDRIDDAISAKLAASTSTTPLY